MYFLKYGNQTPTPTIQRLAKPSKPVDMLPGTTAMRLIIGNNPADQSFVVRQLRRYWQRPDTLHGSAEVLGSPIGTGKLGNGPGVGFSGAGTQRNMFGQGVPTGA